MSGTFPSSPGFQAVNFKINTPTLTSETLSGKKRRVGMGHSYYTFTVKFPNQTSFALETPASCAILIVSSLEKRKSTSLNSSILAS